MNRVKGVIRDYLLVAVILTAYGVVRYLIMPGIANYEVFSYVFWGGLFLYAVYYLLILIVQSLLRTRKETVVQVLFFFFLLEGLLYYFLDSTLLLSLYRNEGVSIFLLYQIIPLSLTVLKVSLHILRKDKVKD